MKRVLTGIMAAVLAVSLCAATAFAAGLGGGRYYVDADGDGVCDHYQSSQGRDCGRGSQGGRRNGFRGGRNR